MRAGGGVLKLVDVQQRAIDATRKRLEDMPADGDGWPSLSIDYQLGDHAALLEALPEASVRLVVFNLGYLPGSDKTIMTTVASTLRALAAGG